MASLVHEERKFVHMYVQENQTWASVRTLTLCQKFPRSQVEWYIVSTCTVYDTYPITMEFYDSVMLALKLPGSF